MMRHEQGRQQRRQQRQGRGQTGRAEPRYAGIDTHPNTHHVAVIDAHGRPVDDVRVEATADGYRQVLNFLARWAGVVLVGVECTGSYGAGVTRALTEAGYDVREVNRPNRFERRASGKTDVFDACDPVIFECQFKTPPESPTLQPSLESSCELVGGVLQYSPPSGGTTVTKCVVQQPAKAA